MRQRSVWNRVIAALAAAIALSLPSTTIAARGGAGAAMEGPARVIDGDTIEIAGVRLRLEGIDAPERAQDCRVGGRTWRAGEAARRRLGELIAKRIVTCTSAGLDRYGRTLARCSVDGRDLARTLVGEGLAWAFVRYSRTFVSEEAEARRAGLGVWRTDAACQTAWDFRHRRWSAVATRSPSGCAIKGNISRHGRIYHMPWDDYYTRTRVDPSRGERWFCDEDEARRAGWRPAAG